VRVGVQQVAPEKRCRPPIQRKGEKAKSGNKKNNYLKKGKIFGQNETGTYQ
jgi:hypothetical protein